VNYSQDIYNNIVIDYAQVANSLKLENVSYIPISAITGDNIVEKTENLSWFEGESLLTFLEAVEVQKDTDLLHARFPVQYVIRPQTEELHDYRGYAGKIVSGIYKKGDSVIVQPAGIESRISKIEIGGKEVEEAFAHQSVVIHLEDDIDISRGDLIAKKDELLQVQQEFDVLLCWMDSKPLKAGNKYILQHNSKTIRSVVKNIEYKLNVNTLQKEYDFEKIGLNDVIRATIKTAAPLAYDTYNILQENGGAILIDETSLVTVGACMIQ